MPSNKWEEAVDDIFEQHYGNKITHAVCAEECMEHENYKNLKLALTNAVKELVASAKPPYEQIKDLNGGWDKVATYHAHKAIDHFEANLLKAIGEKTDE